MALDTSEVSSMEYVMDELEVLEVTETDAALLRDLLEELESEETMNRDDDDNAGGCVMQSAVEANQNRANKDVFEEETLVERNDFCINDSSWPVETMESTTAGCSLLQTDGMVVPDWYAGDGMVGLLGLEFFNGGVGDYSYVSNEITYSCLWEEDS